jgi:hypothetical protein
MVCRFKSTMIFLAFISYAALSGCEGRAPSQHKLASPSQPTVMPLDALVAEPGERVSIKGSNLSSDIFLDVNGEPVELTIIDEETASFVVPESGDHEIYRLSFKTAEQTLNSFSLAKSSAVTNLPVITIPLESICEDTIFKDQKGAVVKGKAKCGPAPAAPKLCSVDGEAECLVRGNYRAANTVNAARKILIGESLAGVAGTALTKPADCATDGQGNCMVDGLAFKAAKLSQFSASDIRSSARIAGIQGLLPNCSADGQIGCLAVGPGYAAMTLVGASAKVLSGQSLGGVAGAAPLAPSPCATDNATNCLATSAFPAVVKANVTAGLIKAGTIIAGVSGAYPSATYPLASNTASPDLTMFQSQLTTNGAFEFFDSAGTRYTGSGDSDLLSSNIRSGTAIESLSLSGTMPASLPLAPTTLSTTYFTGPNRIILNWTAVSGAAGYLLVARTGAAVTFNPTRNQVYTAGAQGSDTILYVGSNLNFVHSGIVSGNSYNYALYSYDANRFYSAVPTRTINTSLFCQGLAGGTWVAVPGDAAYGTSDFCVQKFEAKDVSNTPTSQAASTPWVNITQPTAQAACRSLGTNYDLISNSEWLTIGANMAQVASNWSSGVVGTGTMNVGHSDNNPASACAASTDDTLAWLQTDCTPKNSSSGGTWSQRRTHYLSTGAVIWDLAGNTWDWTSYVIPNNNAKPYVTADGAPVNNWREFTQLNAGLTSMTRGEITPTNAMKAFWNDTWASSAYGMGQFYSGLNGSGGALLRGSHWGAGTVSGVFAGTIILSAPSAQADIGFRCVVRPPTI